MMAGFEYIHAVPDQKLIGFFVDFSLGNQRVNNRHQAVRGLNKQLVEVLIQLFRVIGRGNRVMASSARFRLSKKLFSIVSEVEGVESIVPSGFLGASGISMGLDTHQHGEHGGGVICNQLVLMSHCPVIDHLERFARFFLLIFRERAVAQDFQVRVCHLMFGVQVYCVGEVQFIVTVAVTFMCRM